LSVVIVSVNIAELHEKRVRKNIVFSYPFLKLGGCGLTITNALLFCQIVNNFFRAMYLLNASLVQEFFLSSAEVSGGHLLIALYI